MSTRFSMLLGAVIMAMFAGMPAHAQFPPQKINGGRWCTGSTGNNVSVFVDLTGVPLSSQSGWIMRVSEAVYAWNTELAFGGIPLTLTFVGASPTPTCSACIGIELKNFSTQPQNTTACGQSESIDCPSNYICYGICLRNFSPGPVGFLSLRDFCAPVRVVINTGVINSPNHAHALKTTLHELGHAIGLGHDTEPGHLMSSPAPPDALDVYRYRDILSCIYGGGGILCQHYAIDRRPVGPSVITCYLMECNCEGCTSSVPRTASGPPQTFVLAVNENGGPYEVFATITQDDLGDENDYTHPFTASYDNALFRLQVFENGVMVDETFTDVPIDIEGLACVGDITGNGTVNVEDLLAVIGAWGPCGNPNSCPADIAPPGPPVGDDVVNVQDLLAVIGAWGACQ